MNAKIKALTEKLAGEIIVAHERKRIIEDYGNVFPVNTQKGNVA